MMKGKSGSEGDDDSAQPPRREPKTANKTDDDDPVRFSTIYRMFEAKGAPPKTETGMMANAEAATRPPPPTNRLWPKKVSVSTMTEALAYDEGDVTDDDIHQTDDACGSSTFDQQTQIDDDWLERDDVNRSSNRRRLNGATSSTSGANGDSEKRDYEGDSMSEDGAACQFELAAGGKVAPKIPVGGVIIHSHDEDQLMVRGNRNSPELIVSSVGSTVQQGEGEYVSSKLLGRGHCSSNAASHGMKRCDEDDEEVDDVDSRSQSNRDSSGRGKSVPDLPRSPKVGPRTVPAGGEISVAGDSVGAPPNNQGAEWRSDYSNVEMENRQRGTPLMKNEKDGQKNFGINSPAVGEKLATPVSPGQAGMVAGPRDDRNPDLSGSEIEYHGRSGYSCDQVDDYPKTAHAKSSTQQVTNTLLEENYNVFDTLRLRTSESPAGTASGRSSSKASVETYEDVVPSKSQKVASEGSGYRKDLTETEDGSSTTNEKQSTGQYKSSRERKQNYQYDNVVLPDTHHHHHQQQQQLHSTAVHHPSEPVPPPNSKESGTRKHSSSSGARQDPSSYGTRQEPSSYGTGQEPSSYGTGQEPSSYGTGQEPSSYGTGQDSSSYGTGQNSSSFGTRQDSSSSGTRHDSSSFGTRQGSSSFGTGQNSSSFGTRQDSSSSGTRQDSSSFGTRQDSSSFGTGQNSSSFGTRQDSSSSGTRQDASSSGTRQDSSSYRTGQEPSSFGTRQKSSSSSSIDNAHSLGRDSSTYSTSKLQSTDEAGSCNSYEGVRGTRGTIQMRDVGPTRNAVKTQFAPNESLRKSMSTNTEEYTEYRTTKTCAELECQTDSMDDIVSQSSQSDYNVRDQSTDPDDEDSLDNYFWYFGDIDRELSEAILERMIDRTGSYLVRMSQRGGEGNPYTLSVVYLKRIYHLLIRQRSDGMFSIGKEKNDEKVFFSVPDLMTFYQNNFVELIGDATKKSPSGKVQLKNCPRK